MLLLELILVQSPPPPVFTVYKPEPIDGIKSATVNLPCFDLLPSTTTISCSTATDSINNGLLQ